MKLTSKVMFSMLCVFLGSNAQSQAIDSTGADRLIGVSTRVEAAIPPGTPGTPGPAGATGPKGETGSAGGVQQGSTCGLATLKRMFYDGNESRGRPFTLVSSCMGYRVAYNSGQTTYQECPPGFTTAVLSTTGKITEVGQPTSEAVIYETWTCFKN